MQIIDTDSNTTHAIDALKRAGVEVVGRYYSSEASKRLALPEAQALSAAGIQIFVVFEDSANVALDYETGVHHAQLAMQQAKNIRQPPQSAIYFALDSEIDAQRLADVESYFTGIRDIIDGAYEIGVYGDGVVCSALFNKGFCKYTWLSASRGFPGSREFYQNRRFSLAQDPHIDQDFSGLSIDVNEANGNFGAFQLEPVVEPTEVTRLTANPDAVPINATQFLAGIEPLFGHAISSFQKQGLLAILGAWSAKTPDGDVRWLAYMYATAFHETNRTMQPVREAYWLSEDWRRQHLRYYPFYGRGYVQLTWRGKYAQGSKVVGADLVANPDLALRPDYAALIMQNGMSDGWFRQDRAGRPHNLARYFGQGVDDPVGARNIINGPEWKAVGGKSVLLATIIASYHNAFLKALRDENTGAPEAASNMALEDSAVEASAQKLETATLSAQWQQRLEDCFDSQPIEEVNESAEDLDADPAMPADVVAQDSANFEKARFLTNIGSMEDAASDEVIASSLNTKTSFNMEIAADFLKACETSVPRVSYGLGKKVPFLNAKPGQDFQSVDCSGFVREIVRLATSPSLAFPDGSVTQHEWVQSQGFEASSVAAGKQNDSVVRIAFLRPQDSPEHIGHVVLINNGHTLESHGKVGPDSRIWNGMGWQAKASVYVFARNGVVSLPGSQALSFAQPTSLSFTVKAGHRYRAIISLSGFDVFASNDMVSSRIQSYGFTNVIVTGSGRSRIAEATWAGPDTTAELDPHLSSVTEIPAQVPEPGIAAHSDFEVPPEMPVEAPKQDASEPTFQIPPETVSQAVVQDETISSQTVATMPYTGSSFSLRGRGTEDAELLRMHQIVQTELFKRPAAVVMALGADSRPQPEHAILGVGIGVAHRDFESVGPAGPGAPVLNIYVAEPMSMDGAKALLVDKFGLDVLKSDSRPVNIFLTGSIDAQVHRHRERKSPCGISVGHFKITAGTQGALAVGRSDPRKTKLLLLSNNHVLANANDCAAGDFILQPGPYDPAGTPDTKIALLERWVPIDYTAGATNYVDCATAWCWPDLVRQDYIYQGGSGWQYFKVSGSPLEANRGMLVGKSGRTTQLTSGQVLDVNASIQVNYGAGRVANFVDQITIRGNNGKPFSDGGDSGSLIWTWQEVRSPIALLFAGGAELTFANKIGHVLDALDITLYS
jgi:hypothetical protein